MSALQTSSASKAIGGLLIFTAVLGLIILGVDKVLQGGAPTHFYALIAFIIVDLAVGISIIAKPTKMFFTLAAVWGIVRIILQFGDLTQAGATGFESPAQFADYLFNPMSSVAASLGNSPGVPGALIDLILILEIVVIVVALRGRSSTSKTPA